MPLFTSLASLNVKVDVGQVATYSHYYNALEKLFSSKTALLSEPSLSNLISRQEVNTALWNLMSKKNGVKSAEEVKNILSGLDIFHHFGEETWLLLYLVVSSYQFCQKDIYEEINTWMSTADLTSENGVQAQLFLMSQDNYQLTSVNVDLIFASDNVWAWLGLLSQSYWDFADITEDTLAKLKLRLNDVLEALPSFIKLSGIDIKAKEALLQNITHLGVTEEKIQACSKKALQGLRQIIESISTNRISVSGMLLINITAAMINCLSLEAAETDSTETKQESSREIGDLLISLIESPGKLGVFLNFKNTLALVRQVNEALNCSSGGFFAKFFMLPSRICENGSIDWLVSLDAFKSLAFLDVEPARRNSILLAICAGEIDYFYQSIKRLNLEHPEKPMFTFMSQLKSYEGLNQLLLTDFFSQEEFSTNIQKYLISSSNAFKDLPFIARLEATQNFSASSEGLTIKYLADFMYFSYYPRLIAGTTERELEEDAYRYAKSELNSIVVNIKKNFSSTAFVARLLDCYSNVVQQLLSSLFLEASANDLNDATIRNRKSAELKIKYLFELIKKVRKEASKEYEKLQSSVIFKKLEILDRYVKYSNNSFVNKYKPDWATDQKESLKYLFESIAEMVKKTQENSIAINLSPFFLPVYLKSKYCVLNRPYEIWVREMLFHQQDYYSSLGCGTTDIGGKKLAQTLIFNLHKFLVILLDKSGLTINKLYEIAEIEIGSKANEIDHGAEYVKDADLLDELKNFIQFKEKATLAEAQKLLNDLKSRLSPQEKRALYQRDIYALLHLRCCLLTSDNRFLSFLEYNYEDIKNGTFKKILLTFYEQPSQGHRFTKNMALVEDWFRKNVLKNNSLFKKESVTAQVLMMFSGDFLTNLINGTNITLIEIWNAAYPNDSCCNEEEYRSKRPQNMLQLVGETSFERMTDFLPTSLESSVDNRVPISSEKTAVTPSVLGDSRARLYSSPSSSSSGSPPISPERAKHAMTVGITPK